MRPSLDSGDLFLTFLEPAVDAPVIARSDGIVQSVLAREGQRVARGQALARLDAEEQRLEVEYVGALAAQAKAELERAEKGAQGQWISRQTLDAARAKAAATRADLELAQLALERRTLRAPVGGIVWQVRAEAHRPVKTSDVLFRVTEPGRLRAELFLPAALRARVHAGDAATFVPVSDAGRAPVPGRIALVSPIVDPATARFRVVIETQQAPEGLAGTSVRVRLATAGDSTGMNAGGALLPRGALLERDGGRLYVWRVADRRAVRVPVELGASRPDGYEVLNGLAPGDLVCAAGSPVPGGATNLTPRLVDAAVNGR
ncbi:MAG: efflux RND transporter periplasmic adaptor subunit [Candidatus Eisenbacteria bacterium]